MNNLITKLGLFSAVLLLSGCGLKGPLYFPEQGSSTPPSNTVVAGDTTQTSSSTSSNF